MKNSKIEWTHHTFNPWIGCTKVSAGCANCYAEAQMDKWLNRAKWGPNGTRIKTVETNWEKLPKWDNRLSGTDQRESVFIASLGDIFEKHEDVAQWRFDLWNIVERLQNLDILLLTKRPENILDCTPYTWHNQKVTDQTAHWDRGPIVAQWPAHVWTGASIENQAMAYRRLPPLHKVPGKHFLSLEPLLGSIDIAQIVNQIDWIIIGGESGPHARPMELAWVDDILTQCRRANVPAFVKQLGTHWGKRVGAKHRKGGDPGEWFLGLRARMFPGEVWDA